MKTARPLFLLCFLVLFSATNAQTNLLINGEFESVTDGGQPASWACNPIDETVMISTDAGIEVNGQKSNVLKLGVLKNGNTKNKSISQTVQVQKGVEYMFEGYLRYGSNPDPNYAHLILSKPSSGEVLASYPIPSGNVNYPITLDDIKSFSYTIPSDYNEETITLEINSKNCGKLVRLDNLSFFQVVPNNIISTINCPMVSIKGDLLFFDDSVMSKSISITNIMGEETLLSLHGDYIDLSSLSKGVYIFRAETHQQSGFSIKFLKQ